jgi:PAS domain S-box-containing protein
MDFGSAAGLLILAAAVAALHLNRGIAVAQAGFAAVVALFSIPLLADLLSGKPGSLRTYAPAVVWAIPTSVLFIALAISGLEARATQGLMRAVSAQPSGARNIRRLFPNIMAALTVLAWLTIVGLRRGYYDVELGAAIFLVAAGAVAAQLLWGNARLIERFTEELEARVVKRTADLVAAEQFSHGVLDALTSHIAVVSADGVILAVNDAWRKFAAGNGLEPAAADEGVNYLAVCDRAASQGHAGARAVAAGIRGVIAGRLASFSAEYECHSSTEERWFQCRVTRFSSDGETRAVVSHVNITAESAARVRLERSERRYAALFESAPDAVLAVNRQGVIVALNTQAERLFGWTESELVGRTIEVLIPRSAQSKHEALRDHYAQDPQARQMGAVGSDMRGMRKDGTEFFVEVSLAPIPADEGLLTVASVRDVSQRKALEEALRKSEAQYRLLVEGASEVFYSVMTPGDPLRGTLDFVSQGALPITGHRPEEFIRDQALWVRSVHPDDLPVLAESTRAALAAARPMTRMYRIHDTSGQLHWMEDEISPMLGDEGLAIGYTGVARDVTRNHLLEAQLQQSQKMESIGRLAGGIAHDFNNLLTVIVTTIDLGKEKLAADDPLRTDLEAALHAADRAATLTHQLLAFSRQQILQPKLVDLVPLVENMVGLFRRAIGENVELVFEPAIEVGSVRVDPGQMEQVLLNLVVNARDAMPTGGRLTIRIGAALLDEAYVAEHPSAEPCPHVMLTVSDTGTGMDEATRARIFEPFFTTKGPGQGTGLGLSTAYGIVQQSGGSISVHSELGKGSVFKVYLPEQAESDESAVARAPSPEEEAPINATILVVEDDDRVRGLAVRILASAGYNVLEASNGEEAMRLLHDHRGRVNLLFTDLVMPGMDGRELAVRARDARPGIKVLYTSGFADDAVLRKGNLNNEGASLLSKPYTKVALLGKIREALDA